MKSSDQLAALLRLREKVRAKSEVKLAIVESEPASQPVNLCLDELLADRHPIGSRRRRR